MMETQEKVLVLVGALFINTFTDDYKNIDLTHDSQQAHGFKDKWEAQKVAANVGGQVVIRTTSFKIV
ncbi:double-stranded DNA-binding protein [Bacillus phage BSTP6]|uniref:Double-stranded DNA-binding protein n=1 Tax=Bacillus phage BSTP6 TaxID=2801531 RepID=A0A889INE1_9CAUD|nr:double-stranded DNA-binding protein [Bacillus phage BSTP6]